MASHSKTRRARERKWRLQRRERLRAQRFAAEHPFLTWLRQPR